MERVTSLGRFTCHPFRQEVELQEVVHASGFVGLRLRIREGKRFTVFDIDVGTAEHWGRALLDWAARHQTPEGERKSAG